MTRNEQFSFLEEAEDSIKASAFEGGIPLHRIEFVVPFDPEDFSLVVWFFYETGNQLQNADAMGWSQDLKSIFPRALKAAGYADEWLEQILFVFDSHENVVRDYEGSYFYRLR